MTHCDRHLLVEFLQYYVPATKRRTLVSIDVHDLSINFLFYFRKRDRDIASIVKTMNYVQVKLDLKK